jgi:hypothetical protein
MMNTQTSRSSYRSVLSRLDKVVIVPPGSGSPVNLVMLYEDDETREWTKQVHEHVLKLSGEQGLRPTWWRLHNLDEPGVLAAAVSTAMRADVVVVAVRAVEGLPLSFYTWASSWTRNRLQLNGALVGLLGTQRNMNGRAARVGDYLRTVARQSGLDFILEERCMQNGANGAEVLGNGESRRNNRARAVAARF